MELTDYSAYEIASMVRRREISAREVLESALNRIDAVDGRPGTLDPGPLSEDDLQRVHAFITRTEDIARAQAEDIDRRLAAGEDPGPLAGVPYTVKDNSV